MYPLCALHRLTPLGLWWVKQLNFLTSPVPSISQPLDHKPHSSHLAKNDQFGNIWIKKDLPHLHIHIYAETHTHMPRPLPSFSPSGQRSPEFTSSFFLFSTSVRQQPGWRRTHLVLCLLLIITLWSLTLWFHSLDGCNPCVYMCLNAHWIQMKASM